MQRPRRGGARKLRKLVRASPLAGAVLRLVRRVLARGEPRELEGTLRIGFEGPTDTGLLHVLAWPALVSMGPFSSGLRLEPAFDGPTFELHASGWWRVVPVRLILALTAFALSATTLRTRRAMGRA